MSTNREQQGVDRQGVENPLEIPQEGKQLQRS